MFNGADSQYANLHTYCSITKKKKQRLLRSRLPLESPEYTAVHS